MGTYQQTRGLRAMNDGDARRRMDEETRLADQFQRQGLSRSAALLAAYRIVNGYASPSEDFRDKGSA